MLKAKEINILVADDEEMIQTLISRALSQVADKVICAGNGKEAFELYKKYEPVCVISDILMPVMDGLTFLEKLKEFDPNARVILLTGYGTEKMIIRALRAGALNYLKKPVKIDELISVTKKIISLYHEEQQKTINITSVQSERKEMKLENNIFQISSVINQLLLCATNVCNESSLNGLRTGLYEMIMNAIEHGNLEITFDEKSKALELDKYTELLEQRAKDPKYGQRNVEIDYSMDQTKLEFIIRDEGKGFNWGEVTFKDDLESLSRPHGRGIIMTKFYFDKVSFNEKGNEVTLTKYKEN